MRADLPLRQRRRERALRLGAGARGHAVRQTPEALAGRDRPGRARRRDRGQPDLRADSCAGCRGSGSPMMRRGARGDRSTRRSTGSSGRWRERGMSEPRRDAKWWGWGEPEKLPELDEAARGVAARADRRARALAAGPRAGRLRAAAGAAAAARRWSTAVGAENVFDGAEDRLRHAAGSGYVDLARLRLGALEEAPDAVLVPARRGGAAAGDRRLRRGRRRDRPLRRRHQRRRRGRAAARQRTSAWSASTSPPCARSRSTRRSLTARLGAGLRGPEAEAALAGHGLTLGHFPQSFEYATIGGFAATRSAGQASSGYGRFDSLVSSVRLVAPAGDLETLETPHTAAGPGPARARGRLRGGPRGDPRRHRAGAAGAGGAPLRGLDGGELRGRGGDRPRPRPGAGPAERDPGLRRGGDRELAGAVRPARGRRPALRRLPRRPRGAAAAR